MKVSLIILLNIINVLIKYEFLQVVVPRGPIKAKGLLLACVREPDPCLVLEPKTLYRAAVEEVPTGDYVLPLGKADILREGILRTV